MPIPRTVFEQVQQFEQAGYSPTEILDGLERSPKYADLGKQVRAFRLIGRGDDEILAGLKASYTPEPPGMLERAGQKVSEFVSGIPGAGLEETAEAVGRAFRPKEIGKSLVGLGEAAGTLATGAVALPISGLAGLAALPFSGAEGAKRAIESVQGLLTYQPKTQRGQEMAGTLAWPFQKLHEIAGEAGEATLERTGSPALATAKATAIELLPMLFARVPRPPIPQPRYAGPGATPWSQRYTTAEQYGTFARGPEAPVVPGEVVGETFAPRLPEAPPPALEAPRPSLPGPPPGPPPTPPLEPINLPALYRARPRPPAPEPPPAPAPEAVRPMLPEPPLALPAPAGMAELYAMGGRRNAPSLRRDARLDLPPPAQEGRAALEGLEGGQAAGRGDLQLPPETRPAAGDQPAGLKGSVVKEKVYHGTTAPDFDVFNTQYGAFFSDKRDFAESYTRQRQSHVVSRTKRTGKPRVIEAYIDIRNPLDLSRFGSNERVFTTQDAFIGNLNRSAQRMREILGNPTDEQIIQAIRQTPSFSQSELSRYLELYGHDPMVYALDKIFGLEKQRAYGFGGATPQMLTSGHGFEIRMGQELFHERLSPDVKAFLEGLGFDGVIFKDTSVGSLGGQKEGTAYAVFRPDQIRVVKTPEPRQGMEPAPSPEPAATPNLYEAKRDARIARYEQIADALERKAEALEKAGTSALEQIPLGQPILSGHHSERADRAYRTKARRKLELAAELKKKAEYYRGRAASAASNKAISVDDPEAVVKLKEKIAQAEKNQEFMKRVNAVIRKHKKDPEAGVKALVDMGVPESAARNLYEPDVDGSIGFGAYKLRNNDANIRRMKVRLAELKRAREAVESGAAPVERVSPAGFRVIENYEANRIQLKFDTTPSPEVRALLKSHGFRWSPSEGVWQRHLNNAGRDAAHRFDYRLRNRMAAAGQLEPQPAPEPPAVPQTPEVPAEPKAPAPEPQAMRPRPAAPAEQVPLKEQKQYLLKEIDRAIAEAPDKPTDPLDFSAWDELPVSEATGAAFRRIADRAMAQRDTVTIKVPGDGEFTILNTKEALQKFKELAKEKFPAKLADAPAPLSPAMPAGAKHKRPIDFEGWWLRDEYVPATDRIPASRDNMGGQFDDLFTNGYMVLRLKPGEKVATNKMAQLPENVTKAGVENMLKMHQRLPREKAEIVAEVYPGGTQKGEPSVVAVAGLDTGNVAYFATDLVDPVLTRYPDARLVLARKVDRYMLYAIDGKEPVAVIATRDIESSPFYADVHRRVEELIEKRGLISPDKAYAAKLRGPLTQEEFKRVLDAYRDLTRETGFSSVEIATLADRAEVPIESLHAFIRHHLKDGTADVATGDFSLSSPRVREGAILVNQRSNLLVRFEEEKLRAGVYHGMAEPLGGYGAAEPTPPAPAGERLPTVYSGQKVVHRKVGEMLGPSAVARNAEEVSSLLAPIRKSAQEELFVVPVDESGRVLNLLRYSRGTATATPGSVVEIAGAVMNTPGAVKAYIVHNHPGRQPKFSTADQQFHENIEAALRLKGIDTESVVIAGTWRVATSEPEARPILPVKREVGVPVVQRAFASTKNFGIVRRGADALRVKARIAPDADAGFMLMDHGLHVVGFVKQEPGRTMADVAAQLIQEAERTGATGMIYFSDVPLEMGTGPRGESRRRFLYDLVDSVQDNLALLDVVTAGVPNERAPSWVPEIRSMERSADALKRIREGGRLYGGLPLPAIMDFLRSEGVKTFFDPFHRLPGKEAYLEARYKTLGGIARVERLIERVLERTRKFDEQTRSAMFRFLDGQPVNLPPEAKRVATTLRTMNDMVGQMLVKRGILSQEAFETHRGSYVRYLYLKHVLGDKFQATGSGGRLDLSYTKHRKDLTPEQRAAIGLIEDVSVAESYGLSKSLTDIVKWDLFERIADNPEWVWKPSVIEAGEIRRYPNIMAAVRAKAYFERKNDPVNVMPLSGGGYYLERQSTGEPVRFKIGIEKARKELEVQRKVAEQAKTPEATARLYRLENAIADAERMAGKMTEDFVELPDSPHYGPLAGAYVRKEIAQDIVPFIGRIPDKVHGSKLLNATINAFEAGMTAFKVGKVALNLPTATRNVFSNFVQLNMSGIPWYQIPRYMVRAAEEMLNKGKLYNEGVRHGITKTNWTEGEIGEVLSTFRAMEGGALYKVVSALRSVAKYYGRIDDFFKLAKFIEQRERGVPAGKAAIEAQKWGMDYSIAHGVIRAARRFVAPFVSYPYKVTPLIAEALKKRPWVVAKYVLLPYALYEVAREVLDLTEDDWRRLRKMLPSYIRKNPTYAVLPWKSPEGNLQWVNLGYYFPWGAHFETLHSAAEGDVAGTIGLIGNPYLDLLWSMKSGRGDDPPRDSFTGQEIYGRLDSPTEKAVKVAEWLYNKWAPTMLTRQGAAGYTYRAITGEKDRYGRQVTPGQAAGRWFGVNIVSPTPGQAALERRADVYQLKSALTRALRDPNLTPEQRKRLLERFGSELKEAMGD